MSKTSTYVIVAVAAFLIGGVTFRLVGSTGGETPSKPVIARTAPTLTNAPLLSRG